MLEKFRYNILNVYIGINNLIDYAPIIWKDRDWDQFFLYELMAFKLGKIEKEIESFDKNLGLTYKDHNKRVKNLKIARACLKRLSNEDYFYYMTTNFKEEIQKEERLIQQDLETFAKIFVKHSRTWWT